MTGLSLVTRGGEPLNVLCLGAHADDIEIGCGGTILLLKRSLPQVRLHSVVFSAGGQRGQEARKAAARFGCGCETRAIFKEYRDGFFPYDGGEIKDTFEEMKTQANPDLIFTHWRGDAHQDHRLIHELTWNTYRNHLILEYEIPKYDGDFGRPNLFIPLEKDDCERKVDFLFEAFESQRTKRWFDRDVFLGLMRLRGMESNSHTGYAEAFHSPKAVIQLTAQS
jgi:LmbE family N-acetylglucosaminyl deacetylase